MNVYAITYKDKEGYRQFFSVDGQLLIFESKVEADRRFQDYRNLLHDQATEDQSIITYVYKRTWRSILGLEEKKMIKRDRVRIPEYQLNLIRQQLNTLEVSKICVV